MILIKSYAISLMSRAPYGARGLKFLLSLVVCPVLLSRPVWGAWIEILVVPQDSEEVMSRPVWGAWIEMILIRNFVILPMSRAPYGARGLKSCYGETPSAAVKSRPVWGAWIEIAYRRRDWHLWSSRAPYGARGLKSCFGESPSAAVSRAPYGARGLKYNLPGLMATCIWSRPVWGAWIEIPSPLT